MRYVLAILTMLLAGVAVIAIVTQARQSSMGALGAQPTPRAMPDVAALTSRDALVAEATNLAHAMGERNPTLVGVHHLSFGDALALTDSLPRESSYLPPDDRPVFVVQMRGTFEPLTHPPESKTRISGTMYVIVDAVDGHRIGLGINGDASQTPTITAR